MKANFQNTQNKTKIQIQHLAALSQGKPVRRRGCHYQSPVMLILLAQINQQADNKSMESVYVRGEREKAATLKDQLNQLFQVHLRECQVQQATVCSVSTHTDLETASITL